MTPLIDTNPVVSIIGDIWDLFRRRPETSEFHPVPLVDIVEREFPDRTEDDHRTILRCCADKILSEPKGLFLMENPYFAQHFADPDVGWREAAFQTLLTTEIETPEELCTISGILKAYR